MREVEHRSSSHRSRHTSRSKSRDRERDRERDRDYYSRRRRSKSRSRASKSKKKKSKKKRYRRSSSSSSTTSKTSSRSRGSIKSSGSSIRRTTQPPSSEENSLSIQAKEINLLSDIPERIAIDKIEEDSFTAKPFFSTAESKKIPEKVIIDLKNDTISVEGKVEDTKPEQSQIFHANFLGDDTRKMEKWVKKLYNYRQKAFQE